MSSSLPKNLSLQKVVILFISLPFLWAGCEQATSSALMNATAPPQEQEPNVAQSPIDYIEVKNRLYIDKKPAMEDFQQALRQLDIKIASLEKMIAKNDPAIGHNIKEIWKEDAEMFRLQRDKLLNDYKKLELATPNNWEKLQESFRDRWATLEERWKGVKAE